MLTRKKPLQAKTQLKTKTALTTKKPISKKRSKRARAKDFTPEVKQIVIERSGGLCEICRAKPIEDFHHAIFRSQNGTRDLSNCLGVCRICHDGAHQLRELRELYVEVAKELAAGREQIDTAIIATSPAEIR